MKIGELAKATGTNSETIRYYERIDLLRQPERTDSNYRDYTNVDVERLAFIRHARGLGFDLADVRSLLSLADEPDRDCGQVDRIASEHLASVERKIEQLSRLRSELARMIGRCRGGSISDCRILEVMSGNGVSKSK